MAAETNKNIYNADSENIQLDVHVEEVISKNTNALQIQKKLEMCEHYFVSWLGDVKLQENSLPNMTLEFTRFLGRIPDTESREGSLADDENIKDEYQSSDNNGKSNHNSVYNQENLHYEDFSFVSDKAVYPLQLAVAALTESFLNVQVGNATVAKNKILQCSQYVKLLADKDSSIREYLPGFDFLKTLLETHLRLKEDPTSFKEKDELHLHSAFTYADFNQLSDKGKAIVYLAKWKFLELSVFEEKQKEEAVKALGLVTLFDSSNFVWNFIFCIRLRTLRRLLYGSNSLPDEKEINASVASVEYSETFGGLDHAMCKAGLCQTIAEVLSWRVSQRYPNERMSFGKLIFGTNEDIVKYLRKEARNALTRYPDFRFAEYIRYSEIFFSSLPFQYRNPDICILLMTFCLKVLPSNSKANHKMGILYLIGDGDIQEAIAFFRRAVQCDPKNFPAWMDLIKSLLQSPFEHDEELDNSFKTIWETLFFDISLSWKESQAASLKFIKGCYFFMKGEKDSAIETWISYCKYKPQKDNSWENNFQRLFHMKRRYHWPASAMKLDEVLKAVRERRQQTGDSDGGLKLLENEITAAFRNPRDVPNAHSQRFGASWDDGRVFRAMSEVDKDVNRGQWGRDSSTSTVMSNSGNRSTNYSPGRSPYSENRNNGNQAARPDYRQRRRSPSPDNWRS